MYSTAQPLAQKKKTHSVTVPLCSYSHTQTHTQSLTVLLCSYLHTQTHTHIHTQTHTHTVSPFLDAHTCTHKHTHTHTHTHSLTVPLCSYLSVSPKFLPKTVISNSPRGGPLEGRSRVIAIDSYENVLVISPRCMSTVTWKKKGINGWL